MRYRTLRWAAVAAIVVGVACTTDTTNDLTYCDHYDAWASASRDMAAIEDRNTDSLLDWSAAEYNAWSAAHDRRSAAALRIWDAAPSDVGGTFNDVASSCGVSPPHTATTVAPTTTTTEWTVEQRRALRDLAGELHDVAALPCGALQSVVGDPIEADYFRESMTILADDLATIGADPSLALEISRIWGPPDAAPRARAWCAEWSPRFRALGDYLQEIAERGHP